MTNIKDSKDPTNGGGRGRETRKLKKKKRDLKPHTTKKQSPHELGIQESVQC